jgi:hypothetical protein
MIRNGITTLDITGNKQGNSAGEWAKKGANMTDQAFFSPGGATNFNFDNVNMAQTENPSVWVDGVTVEEGDAGGGELTELSTGTERGIGLGGSLWGGAATMTYADELANGVSTTAKGMSYLRVGGNILGSLGFVATTYNNVVKFNNGDLHTADVVDWGISGGMVITGILVSNPVGLTVLAIGGIGYGIYRLSAGDNVDAWINENWDFNP